MFLDIKQIILDCGITSCEKPLDEIKKYLKENDLNIRFLEEDIKKIFVTYQTYCAYRYSDKLDKKVDILIKQNTDSTLINKLINEEIKKISNDSSFCDYQTRIVEDIMEYLKSLNKFQFDLNENYFTIKDKISIIVRNNYKDFINLCSRKLNNVNYSKNI